MGSEKSNIRKRLVRNGETQTIADSKRKSEV